MKKLTIKQWLIIAVVVWVGLVVVFVAMRRGDAPPDQPPGYTFVDEHTGETIRVTPGVTPEKYGSRELATVIGLRALAEFGVAGLADAQIPVFRKDLATNGLAKIGTFDEIVRVVRPFLNPETLLFEVDLIYLKNTPPAKLVFDIPDNNLFRYWIVVNGQEVYRSPPLFADGQGGLYGE